MGVTVVVDGKTLKRFSGTAWEAAVGFITSTYLLLAPETTDIHYLLTKLSNLHTK